MLLKGYVLLCCSNGLKCQLVYGGNNSGVRNGAISRAVWVKNGQVGLEGNLMKRKKKAGLSLLSAKVSGIKALIRKTGDFLS